MINSKDNIIKVENVSKLYGMEKNNAYKLLQKGKSKAEVFKQTGVNTALFDISMNIPKGKIVVIIGLSGSGKSTLIRCFNRLNSCTGGHIYFENTDIHNLKGKDLRNFRKNKVSMVFQSFALLSNRNVMQNAAFGLEIKGMGKEEREAKAQKYIDLVGLSGYETADISELSGGMKQRVGIARALANETELILMDEPFSALDPLVRSDLQYELLKIQRKLKKTIIFITHDIDEAFKLGDYVAILKDGRLVQYCTPENMSIHPENEYVKNFIENADKAKVLTVKNIMMSPNSIAKESDDVNYAIRVMKQNAISSAFVVDEDLKLSGIISIQEAMRASAENLAITDILDTNICRVKEDDLIADITPLSSASAYPLAVIDKDGTLTGIVTKSSVLAAFSK